MGLEMDQDAFAKKNEIKAKQNPGYIKVMEVDNKHALMPTNYIHQNGSSKNNYFSRTFTRSDYVKEKKNINQTCKTCSRRLRNIGIKIHCQTP